MSANEDTSEAPGPTRWQRLRQLFANIDEMLEVFVPPHSKQSHRFLKKGLLWLPSGIIVLIASPYLVWRLLVPGPPRALVRLLADVKKRWEESPEAAVELLRRVQAQTRTLHGKVEPYGRFYPNEISWYLHQYEASLGNYEEALAVVEELCSDPVRGYVAPAIARAEYLVRLGRGAEALTSLESWLPHDDRDGTVWRTLKSMRGHDRSRSRWDEV